MRHQHGHRHASGVGQGQLRRPGQVVHASAASHARPSGQGGVVRAKTRQPSKIVRVEVAAGGVVFKHAPQGIKVAFILDPYGKWAFAKGHVEKGETIEQAALRETREEMGLGRLRVVASLGKIDFWFRDRYREGTKGEMIHKHVHFFLMEAPPSAQGQPQKKERISKVIWVDLSRVLKMSGYKDVRPLIMKVRAYFSGSLAHR